MENDSELKIMTHDGRILSLQQMYGEHEKTHAEQAALPFEEKIRILVDLQRLAFSWGEKTDIIVWKMIREER